MCLFVCFTEGRPAEQTFLIITLEKFDRVVYEQMSANITDYNEERLRNGEW